MLPFSLSSGIKMDKHTTLPAGNVLPFPSEDRRKASDDSAPTGADSYDHGPSPEESLRVMRAFVGIKNRKLREDLIEMIEGKARLREQTPTREA
jgi:hypothetical protein